MREDKTPKECLLEEEKYTEKLLKVVEKKNGEKNNIYQNIKNNNNNETIITIITIFLSSLISIKYSGTKQ